MSATNCPECGGHVESDTDVCAVCGASFLAEPTGPSLGATAVPGVCPGCGAAVPEAAEACRQCGEKLASMPPEQAEEESEKLMATSLATGGIGIGVFLAILVLALILVIIFT